MLLEVFRRRLGGLPSTKRHVKSVRQKMANGGRGLQISVPVSVEEYIMLRDCAEAMEESMGSLARRRIFGRVVDFGKVRFNLS